MKKKYPFAHFVCLLIFVHLLILFVCSVLSICSFWLFAHFCQFTHFISSFLSVCSCLSVFSIWSVWFLQTLHCCRQLLRTAQGLELRNKVRSRMYFWLLYFCVNFSDEFLLFIFFFFFLSGTMWCFTVWLLWVLMISCCVSLNNTLTPTVILPQTANQWTNQQTDQQTKQKVNAQTTTENSNSGVELLELGW